MKTIFFLLCFFSLNKLDGETRLLEVTPLIELTPIDSLTTEEKIVAVLVDSGYSRTMQRIILAVAKHESGVFTNPLSKYHYNFFSMQHPKRRATLSVGPMATAEGRRSRYGSYLSIDSAVTDYLMHKRYLKLPDATSAKQYVYAMKAKGYFEDNPERYLRAIWKHMKADSTVRNFSLN